MRKPALDKVPRMVQRVGVATFVLGLAYGAVLHGPYVWYVVLG